MKFKATIVKRPPLHDSYEENCCDGWLYHLVDNEHNIAEGEVCVRIIYSGVERTAEYYCKSCIDLWYQKLKPVFDTKLWAFQ